MFTWNNKPLSVSEGQFAANIKGAFTVSEIERERESETFL